MVLSDNAGTCRCCIGGDSRLAALSQVYPRTQPRCKHMTGILRDRGGHLGSAMTYISIEGRAIGLSICPKGLHGVKGEATWPN